MKKYKACQAVIDLYGKNLVSPYRHRTQNEPVDVPSYYGNIDRYAIFPGRQFQSIFGTQHRNSDYYKKHLPLVKIERSGKVIYREFLTVHGINQKKYSEYVALSYRSLLSLSAGGDDIFKIDEVSVSEPNKIERLRYYLEHPDPATRVSTKIGILGIAAGVVGVILSLVSLLKSIL